MTKQITATISIPDEQTKKLLFDKAREEGLSLSAYMVSAGLKGITSSDMIQLTYDLQGDKYILVPKDITSDDLKRASEILGLITREG